MLERVLITFNETYKETKETWVTGYTGTTGAEVALVVAAVPVRSQRIPSTSTGIHAVQSVNRDDHSQPYCTYAMQACIFLNSALVSFLNVSGLVRPTREVRSAAGDIDDGSPRRRHRSSQSLTDISKNTLFPPV